MVPLKALRGSTRAQSAQPTRAPAAYCVRKHWRTPHMPPLPALRACSLLRVWALPSAIMAVRGSAQRLQATGPAACAPRLPDRVPD